MKLIAYNSRFNRDIFNLFYNTVHYVNCRDYNKDQLDAWAREDTDLDEWAGKLASNYSRLVEMNGRIVGFIALDKTGYLDLLYVHKDYQDLGVASLLLEDALDYARKNKIESISSHVSITARPFFQRRGFKLVEENTVELNNIKLENFLMEKRLIESAESQDQAEDEK